MFAASLEVVLGVVAYVAVLTYLFVVDPQDGATLLGWLFGDPPAALPVALALLVLWDVCYRIGTGWWTAVVGLWGALTQDLTAAGRTQLGEVARRTLAFGLLQSVLVPFVRGHPLLVVGVAGHVVAVVVVTTASLYVRQN